MVQIKMVVGLGNPGREYVNTRHNVGFEVIDSLAGQLKIDVRRKKFGAVLGWGEFENTKLILLKPWQFMNRSGQPTATVMGFYKLDRDDLLVISDDMALEPGRIRIRAQGSAGGHKGLADVIEKLGTDNISRLRIGIGQCGSQDAEYFVLNKPAETERPLLDDAIAKATDAVLCWAQYGIEKTMNRFNQGLSV